MRRLAAALLTGAVTGCAGAGLAGSTVADGGPGGMPTGTVIEVRDGDTVEIRADQGVLEVRLAGINAPESSECFHAAATDRLRALVSDRPVAIEEIELDQFGRTLAYLWDGAALVNLEMVASGSAIATTPDGGDPHGGGLIAAEEGAAHARLGLWAADACGAGSAPPPVDVDVEPDPPGPDEDSLDREWVDFTSPAAVGASGWMVRDESSAHRCVLPEGTSIGPDQALRVTSADPCWDPGGSPVWNNGGDVVLFLDSAGTVVARHRYQG